MAYDSAKREYAKEHFWFIEIEADTGTYRFCENRSPLPRYLKANPSLQSVRVNPAEIDLSGGIGVRAKTNLSLIESVDFTEWGSLSNPERFWARWRAENPYYLGNKVSVYSGYIVNNSYDISNFVKRDYIIESFGQTGAGVSITGKDPLKLLSNDRAKAPRESNGSLVADILSTDSSFTLQPSGIGDAEYPSSGKVRIGDEVIIYTTRVGDVFSGLTRGFRTQADDHSENDTVQLCLEYSSDTVSDIGYDLMTNYANIDPSFINKGFWDAEVDNSFTVTYSALITEPTGVQDLLREFCDSAPHYYFYDERVNLIQLVALKPPPTDAQLISYKSNIIKGSMAVKDRQDLRISTVIVNYGIIDPTKDLDETSNYRASYVREDSDSVTNYGQRAYKTIHSRWINSDNKTAAVLMSARVGRRFAEAPRQVTFSLDAKDSDMWAGDSVRIETDLILAQGGGIATLPYQIMSAGESKNFDYTALEHTYGASVPGDEDVEDPNVRLVYLSGEIDRLKDGDGPVRNLRDIYESVYGLAPLDSGLDIRFIFESNCVAGSSQLLEYGVKTGAWPELTTPILIQNNGLILGKGGDGGAPDEIGFNGGSALQLEANIRLKNLNTIGGGGGGGGGAFVDEGDIGVDGNAGGGGGAGFFVGLGRASAGGQNGQNGTFTTGGDGGDSGAAKAGDGGGLGQNGQTGIGDIPRSGGLAGKAIDLNGFTITYEETGTILGAVS